MDMRNGGAQATQVKIEINDILERLAYVLAKQTEWPAIQAVHDCIAAIENLENQDQLELARQHLRSNHNYQTECP